MGREGSHAEAGAATCLDQRPNYDLSYIAHYSLQAAGVAPRLARMKATFLQQWRHTEGSTSSLELSHGLTLAQFQCILLSSLNRATDERKLAVRDDGDAPLAHYWVSASHNSYLEGNQLISVVSAAMYARLLLQGCRSLEIDLWDGPDGEPTVTHGNTVRERNAPRPVWRPPESACHMIDTIY